jgi:putative oxidoreductase
VFTPNELIRLPNDKIKEVIMVHFMSSFRPQVYALLRIVLGLLFALHGAQKFGIILDVHPGTPDFVTYVAGPIEIVAGLMIAIGFMTHWAAFLASGLMAAAYWMAHGMTAFLPQENGGELAALYCFAFLFISAEGSGIWSFDALRK